MVKSAIELLFSAAMMTVNWSHNTCMTRVQLLLHSVGIPQSSSAVTEVPGPSGRAGACSSLLYGQSHSQPRAHCCWKCEHSVLLSNAGDRQDRRQRCCCGNTLHASGTSADECDEQGHVRAAAWHMTTGGKSISFTTCYKAREGPREAAYPSQRASGSCSASPNPQRVRAIASSRGHPTNKSVLSQLLSSTNSAYLYFEIVRCPSLLVQLST